MSCEACDDAQEAGRGTYFRIDRANVYVSACDDHLKAFQRILRGEAR